MDHFSESNHEISWLFQVPSAAVHLQCICRRVKEFDALIYVVPSFFSVAMAIRTELRIAFRIHEPKIILPNTEMALTKELGSLPFWHSCFIFRTLCAR
jgi:hypothetical protein